MTDNTTRSLVGVVRSELKDHGPEAVAELLSRQPDELQVVTDGKSRATTPTLRPIAQKRERWRCPGDEHDRTDYDEFVPVARAGKEHKTPERRWWEWGTID